MWTVLAALQMEYGAIRGEELEPLMAGLAAGDQEALGQLYRRTRTAVYGLALSILRHGHDAEDVTQDTFVRAWEKAEQYRPQGTPMAWLLAITRNLALMKLRERARTQDLPPLYEETSGFYIYKAGVMTELGRRIGDRPKLITVSEVESCDIDEAEDFYIADAIYNYQLQFGKGETQ